MRSEASSQEEKFAKETSQTNQQSPAESNSSDKIAKRDSSGTDTSSLASNVTAAINLAEVIRSTLGPRGLDKLLLDQLGRRVVTNDGYTVLVSMKLDHPVSKLLVEIAERQQLSMGDGTTSVVLMAAEMLREGYRATTEYKIHPTKVIRQIDEGIELVISYLKACAVPIESLSSPLIKDVVQTATASKLDGAQLSSVIMRALDLLNKKGREDLRHGIMLLRRLGEDLLVEGVVVEHLPRDGSFLESLHEPNALLIRDTLKPPLLGHKIEGDNDTFDKEKGQLISNLVINRVSLVITNAPDLDLGVMTTLASKKIAVLRTSTEELQLLSRAMDVVPAYGMDVLTDQFQKNVFSLENIVLDEDNRLTILRKPRNEVVTTLIVGGATSETSKERARTVTDGISAAHFAIQGGVVAGGGIAELNASQHLRKQATEQGNQKPGHEVVMKGLESISSQILENSGYNGRDSLLKLKTKPESIGIDIDTGGFVNMIVEGIVDPLLVKTSALQAAAHITKTILKIDRNIVMQDDQITTRENPGNR